MKVELIAAEIGILDSILKYIPIKDRFTFSWVYYLNIIIPKYPEIKKNPSGGLMGNDQDAQKENAKFKDAYKNITTFLVEKDFANRDEQPPKQEYIILTDKGRKLIESESYENYLIHTTSEQGRLEALEEGANRMAKRTIELSEKMTKLTYFVAFGTVGLVIVAIIQLLWDYYKFYHPFCP